MSLILAIVADPHEAAQLAALIQGRLSVHLVQAAEVGEGLLALDDRIPDLILTSPLMSPFDDGVLDEYLRDLGPAGAHVQTLRIPVLSQAPKKAQRLGFSLRRRAKPAATTPEGCEPKVFADEIEQYLARAAEEKRHAASNDISPVEAPAEVTEPAIGEEVWTPAYSSDSSPEEHAWSAPEPEADTSAWRADLLDRPPVQEAHAYDQPQVETVPTWEEETISFDPIAALPVDEESVPEPSDLVAEPIEPELQAIEASTSNALMEAIPESPAEESAVVEVAVAEPVEVAVAESGVVEAPVRLQTDASIDSVAEAVDVAAEASTPTAQETDSKSLKATPSFKAALEAIRAAWGKPSRKATPVASIPADELPAASGRILRQEPEETDSVTASAEIPAPLEVDLTGAVEMLDEQAVEVQDNADDQLQDVPAQPRQQAIGGPESVDVYELSVEPDLRELESQLLTPLAPRPKREDVAPPPPVEPPAIESRPPVEPAGDQRKKSAKRGHKAAKSKSARTQSQPQSAQDEWGIFDPSQCGFAALVDKLDEVSDEKTERKTGSKVRVISCS